MSTFLSLSQATLPLSIDGSSRTTGLTLSSSSTSYVTASRTSSSTAPSASPSQSVIFQNVQNVTICGSTTIQLMYVGDDNVKIELVARSSGAGDFFIKNITTSSLVYYVTSYQWAPVAVPLGRYHYAVTAVKDGKQDGPAFLSSEFFVMPGLFTTSDSCLLSVNQTASSQTPNAFAVSIEHTSISAGKIAAIVTVSVLILVLIITGSFFIVSRRRAATAFHHREDTLDERPHTWTSILNPLRHIRQGHDSGITPAEFLGSPVSQSVEKIYVDVEYPHHALRPIYARNDGQISRSSSMHVRSSTIASRDYTPTLFSTTTTIVEARPDISAKPFGSSLLPQLPRTSSSSR